MKSPRHARKTPSSRASGGINSQGTRLATGLIGRGSLEKRCPSDGDRGFESLSLQRRVSCEPDFRGRIPSMIVGVPTSGANFLTGDRGFESTSLQRRVTCEPDFLDQIRKFVKCSGAIMLGDVGLNPRRAGAAQEIGPGIVAGALGGGKRVLADRSLSRSGRREERRAIKSTSTMPPRARCHGGAD